MRDDPRSTVVVVPGSHRLGYALALLVVALILAMLGATITGTRSPGPTSAAEPTTTPAATPTPAPTGPPVDAVRVFHSRPDLRPPVMDVKATEAAGDDLLLITPRYGGAGEGVMILDAQGELVWLRRVPGLSALNLHAVTYQGAPALGWWEGVVEGGLGDGEFVIIDPSYRDVAHFRTVRYPADLHDFVITPQDTAYVLAIDVIELDGQLIDDTLVQEVDIADRSPPVAVASVGPYPPCRVGGAGPR